MSAFDTSDMRRFAADLSKAPERAFPRAQAATFKAAMKIKGALVADAQASTHFKGIARSIDFDMLADSHMVGAEIGPRSEPGEAGNLANIAYFGNSRGAGGTVRDPQAALDEEAPKYEAALADILRDST